MSRLGMNAVPHHKSVEHCQHQSLELFRRRMPPICETRASIPLVPKSLSSVAVAEKAKHFHGARRVVSSPQQPFLAVGWRP